MNPSRIRYLRQRAQKLVRNASDTPRDPRDLLRELCGVQAQDLSAANLAFQPRSRNLTRADVARARVDDGAIVRTWCMRGTLHLFAAEDLGWLLPLFGPIFVRKSRRRYRQLELSEPFCAQAIAAMPAILAGNGPMTRDELAAALDRREFPTTGQASYHLLRRAALEGVICYGPDREGEPAFVLLDEWVPQRERSLDRDAALALLARRYLAAYGPARAEDLASWSGLPMKDVRAGLAQIMDELLELESADDPYLLLQAQAAWLDERQDGPAVRLLPAFDTYLLGYRSRDLSVPHAHAKRVHPGGGILRATLMVDGVAAGMWRQKRRDGALVVQVEPFAALNDDILAALAAEVDDLGRYLGAPTGLEIVA